LNPFPTSTQYLSEIGFSIIFSTTPTLYAQPFTSEIPFQHLSSLKQATNKFFRFQKLLVFVVIQKWTVNSYTIDYTNE